MKTHTAELSDAQREVARLTEEKNRALDAMRQAQTIKQVCEAEVAEADHLLRQLLNFTTTLLPGHHRQREVVEAQTWLAQHTYGRGREVGGE
jgi:hypothetical protein